MSLDPGTRLGPYEIVTLLGAGGMGEVYRARDTKLDRDVAIKVLPAHLSSDPEALVRFEREAKSVAALSHPNILAIYDFAAHEGTAYAVTELLAGETLRERLAAGALPVRRALDFAVQIAEGLAAAHEKGLVHRDVKPENVFVTTESRAKILDFGLVRHASGEHDAATVAGSRTVPGAFLGTVGYASPEQAIGRPVDFRSDQFSLGSVLYEMLTGRRAFARLSGPETLAAIIRDEPEPIATLNPAAPAPLRWIIERCLAKDPTERYASTEDLARELRTLRDHLTEATSTGEIASAARTAGDGGLVDRTRGYSRAVGAVAIGLLVLVSAGVYFGVGRGPKTAVDSLAVLPLTNGSGDPQAEYLSDGITESLINSLSQLPTLRVMARTTVFRYKGRVVDPITIGSELGVRRLLTGKVVQRGDRLSIQVDLIDVANGAQLWGERYDRKLADILTMQEEIARHVSEKLRLNLTGEQQQRLVRRSTGNVEAYQLYLRGSFHWNKLTEEGVKKSIEYFNQALAKDPGYALAYAGLSGAYGVLGQIGQPPKENAPRAKAYAEKALELDETLPDAHLAWGAYDLFYGWDWAVAEREVKRAIELNPNFGLAHDLYGQFLGGMGRFDEAIAENRRALEFDPLSANSNSNLGLAYYYARQHDRVVEQCRRTLELDPNFVFASLYIGFAYGQQGKYQEAITELLKTRDLPGGFAPGTSELGYVYAVSGQRAEAQKMLQELQEHASREYIDPYYIAIIHLGLDDLDQTFAWLDRAYAERSFWLLWLKVEPKFDRLRPDRRLAALQQRINFPK